MASTSTAAPAITSPPPASPKAPVAPSAKPASTDQPRPILETTWHALSQSPPPALREILGAYNAKGEGDREMLIALLNAKAAEDQRLAATAQLHQNVLQMQHALALAAVTAQQPAARPPQPPQPARKKRSHSEYAPDAYRLQPQDDREPPLPPSPDSSASGSSPRADFPHLTNPGTMSIRTLLHPSKRRRESYPAEREHSYDERDRERDRDRERAYLEDREYRSSRRPHVVVHPPTPADREYRHAMRTSSARDEAPEPGRSP